MSTRGLIGIKTREGWKTIYNHSDSYPEYLGKMLHEHYSTRDKAEELVDLGDLSFVGPEIGEKHNFDKAYEEHPKWTLAYGRDRGESDTHPRTYKTLEEVHNRAERSGAEYVYLFDNGKWKAYEVKDRLVPLHTKHRKLVKV